MDYSVALGVTTFLAKEDHFVVWAIASSHLLAIDTHLRLTPAYSDYRVKFNTLLYKILVALPTYFLIFIMKH